ncbi:MAG: hypothetical protein IPM28_01920 [Chloracidobacterium sp.]|nr:hypothetical protein [Chloracidobacterium sp.]
MSVLQIDAHADLRDTYDGTRTRMLRSWPAS